MSITAILFDYGCVLSMMPRSEDYEPLRKAVGAEEALFQQIYWRNREAYDVDTLNVAAYFQELGQAAGVNFSPEQIQNLALLDSQIWASPNAIMVEFARVLRERGFKTAVLSNMSVSVGDHLRRASDWLNQFDHLCFSGELRMGKPEPGIYHSCLQSLGVTAPQSLFIDDREVNIQAARALGMNGIVFQSADQLEKDLKPYGLDEPLAQAKARVA